MGANEKYEAAMHGGEYTPATENVEHSYVAYRSSKVDLITGHHEFTRWLAIVRAEAKAEALEEAAGEIDRLDSDVEMYDENLNARQVSHWLRAHAEQYKEQS